MLDKKSISVLKTLNKLSDGNAYKVITTDDILSCISNRSQFDNDSIRQIIEFLEKQEYINIKFYEESTYCYSLTPKGRILLEQDQPKARSKKNNMNWVNYLLVGCSAFIGSMLALLVFFYLI